MRYFDFFVIGSGIVGLRYVLEVVKYGLVVIFMKFELYESNIVYVQGGVSVVLDFVDFVESYI